MYYFVTGFAIGLSSIITYNYKSITNYALKILEYYPGEGEIYKKRKNYFIKNPERDLRLNYIKMPCFDINVYYFKNIKAIKPQVGRIDKSIFYSIYEDVNFYKLRNKGTGIIEDVYYTNNLTDGDLYGYISSYTEEDIYIFKIEKGIIDLKKVFEEYLEEFDY